MATSLSWEDLTQGLNEWRNIQDIVRTTFKTVFEVIKRQEDIIHDQAAALSRLEKALEQKVNKTDLHQTLAQKASVSDVAHLSRKIGDLNKTLEMKADKAEIVAEVDKRITHSDFAKRTEELLEMIENRVSQKDLERFRSALVNDFAARLLKKADKTEFESALKEKADASELQHLRTEAVHKHELAHINTALDQIAATLDRMREELDGKAAVADVLAALEKKISTEDLEGLVREVAEMKRELESGSARASSTGPVLGEVVQLKMAKQLSALKKKLQSVKDELNDVIRRQQEEHRQSTSGEKVSRAEVLQLVEHKSKELFHKWEAEVGHIRSELREWLTNKAATKDEVAISLEQWFQQAEESLRTELKALQSAMMVKVDRTELQSTLVKVADKSDADLHTILEEFQKLGTAAVLKEELPDLVVTAVREAVRKEAVGDAMLGDASTLVLLRQQLDHLVHTKADAAEVAEELRKRPTTDEIKRVVEEQLRPLPKQALVGSQGIYSELETLRKELLLKASIQDVCTLLDAKANIEDVQQAIMEVRNEVVSGQSVRAKAGDVQARPLQSARQLEEVVRRLEAAYIAELQVGRWIWKSGRTKGSGHGVPWNVQTVNTSPDNFVWEKDKVTLVVVAPGLYEVAFGFYARKKPAVQLLVNGEPVLSAVNNSSYVVHHSSGRLATVGQHSAGNITGLTMIDFLVLPAKARLAVCYSGEEDAEGFFSLRKL